MWRALTYGQMPISSLHELKMWCKTNKLFTAFVDVICPCLRFDEEETKTSPRGLCKRKQSLNCQWCPGWRRGPYVEARFEREGTCSVSKHLERALESPVVSLDVLMLVDQFTSTLLVCPRLSFMGTLLRLGACKNRNYPCDSFRVSHSSGFARRCTLKGVIRMTTKLEVER
jgi:hypothetical protein